MAKITARKPRNRAAQDATLMNIRSLKKRVAVLEKIVFQMAKRR